MCANTNLYFSHLMSSKRDVTNSILFNFANDVHSEIGKIRVKPIYAEVFLANLIVAFVLNQNSFSHLLMHFSIGHIKMMQIELFYSKSMNGNKCEHDAIVRRIQLNE